MALKRKVSSTSIRKRENSENIPPTTPKKNTKTTATPVTPVSVKRTVSLFTPTKRLLTTPTKTPGSGSPGSTSTVFTRAKAVLRRGSTPCRLAARNTERSEIVAFLSHRLEKVKKGGFMYICGPPGTGKTALMNEIYKEYKETCESSQSTVKASMETAFINCMSFQNAEDVYTRITEELRTSSPSSGDAKYRLDQLFNKRKTMILIVLDEIDHLVTKDQEVMYKLIEHANKPTSKLVLIGIANSLNLPDRFLPRLKGKSIEPKRLSFNPYTTDEIIQIITTRLRSLDSEAQTLPMIDDKAIQLCARKVSAASGDLRMALDICRRAIELVESEELARREIPKKVALQESTVQQKITPSPSPSPAKRRRVAATHEITLLTPDSAPKVMPQHIIAVTKTLGSASAFIQLLKGLPIHHKAILCTLSLMTGEKSKTLGEVADKYVRLCKRGGLLDPIPRGEIWDACKQLHEMNVIAIDKAKGSKKKGGDGDRERRVALMIQEVDVLQCISGMEPLQKFFED